MYSDYRIVRCVLRDGNLDNSTIQNVQGCVNEEMIMDGWISIILSNKECIMLKFNNGVFSNEGFIVDDEKVLNVIEKDKNDGFSYRTVLHEEGIADLDHGSRFEGLVLKESGIPFGFGSMYDDDGLLIYEGIMIDWKRFGYGVSYHNNGLVEYEGYWCDDKRFGNGKLYDRSGELVKECEWWDGSECNTDVYEGTGSKPINIGINHLKLENKCILKDWNVSWLSNLESIEIGDDCFGSVQTFKIEGLKRLKSVKIGRNSFTQVKENDWMRYLNDSEDSEDSEDTNSSDNAERKADNPSRSFHILDCESLESIQIGEYSFSDFGGGFELSNLKSLKSIQIGTIGSDSRNFYWSSCVIRGMDMILTIE